MIFTDLFESFDNATANHLEIGDPVIITGPVQYRGKTGDIIDFGRDKNFVIVDLYNHGKHSFHSSDVSFNEYAGSEEEENDWQEREDYGTFGDDERDEDLNEGFGAYYYEQLAQKMFDLNPNFNTKGRADELVSAGYKQAVQDLGKKRASWEFNYDEDFISDFVSAYGWLQSGEQGVAETALNPLNPKSDLAAKRKALQDLSMTPGVDQKAVQQRKLDLEREAAKKGVTEGSLNEGLSTDRLAGMIAARLERLAPNVFTDYGIEYVLDAVRDVAEFYAMSDFEELGTSDLGAMARSVVRQLKQQETQMNRGV